jgi:hydroxylamine reductase (hybrid-cluster protein)
MNILQERSINNSKSSIEATKRALAGLSLFGWKLSMSIQPIEDFAKTVKALDENATAQRKLAPKASKSHREELANLLEEENYLVTTADALAKAAAKSLTQEEISFFEKRDQFVQPVKDRINNADQELQSALCILAGALQARWSAMQNLHQLQTILFAVSSIHQLPGATPEPGVVQLGKPFPKYGHFSYPPFVKAFLERTYEVFAGAENWQPEDAAERVYEK